MSAYLAEGFRHWSLEIVPARRWSHLESFLVTSLLRTKTHIITVEYITKGFPNLLWYPSVSTYILPFCVRFNIVTHLSTPFSVQFHSSQREEGVVLNELQYVQKHIAFMTHSFTEETCESHETVQDMLEYTRQAVQSRAGWRPACLKPWGAHQLLSDFWPTMRPTSIWSWRAGNCITWCERV